MTLPAPPGYHYDELGAFVVAPCTHDAPCPLAGGLWCSFSQKVNQIDCDNQLLDLVSFRA